MDWITIDDVHWLAVLLATLSSFAVGSLWYSMKTFGPKWAEYANIDLTDSDHDGLVATMGITFVASAVTALTLAMLMPALGTSGIGEGALLGAFLGFVFRLGTHVIHNGFVGRPAGLTIIDGMHDVVALALAGAILGIWT